MDQTSTGANATRSADATRPRGRIADTPAAKRPRARACRRQARGSFCLQKGRLPDGEPRSVDLS